MGMTSRKEDNTEFAVYEKVFGFSKKHGLFQRVRELKIFRILPGNDVK